MKKKRLHCGTKFLRVLIFVIFLGSAKISSCKKEKSAGNIFLAIIHSRVKQSLINFRSLLIDNPNSQSPWMSL